MKQYEVSAKNVESAIQQGLLELGLEREDVDIKIVEAGGMFKKAKVVLEYQPKIEEQTQVEEQPPEIKKENKKENKKVEKLQPILTDDESVEEDSVEDEQSPEKVIKQRTFKPVEKNAEVESAVTEFLDGLMLAMKVSGKVVLEYSESALNCQVVGENVGKLIGFRGETLNAIQQILSNLIKCSKNRIRILFDVENYRQKRERTLVDLGIRMAKKAKFTHKNVHLDPMTPYERRIVHTALQEIDDIETESFGEGDRRHIVIKVKE